MNGKWEYHLVYEHGRRLDRFLCDVTYLLNRGWTLAGPLVVVGAGDEAEYYQPMTKCTPVEEAAENANKGLKP